MIEINLLPDEMRKKESLKITLPNIPIRKTMIIFFASFFSFLLFFSALTFYFSNRVNSMTKQIAALQVANQETARQKSETAVLRNRLNDAQLLTTRKFSWTSVLNSLSDSMTKGVWLQSLSVMDEDVAVSGKPSSAESAKDKTKKPDNKPKKSDDKTKKPEDKKEKAPSKSKSATGRSVFERRRVLKLEGSAVGAGQETAVVGKFLKELKENAFFKDLFGDVKLSAINQRKIKDFDVYDFTLSCQFRKDKA